MNPKKLGGKASNAATSSSSPKNWVGHSSEGSGFGNIPKVDQLNRDVAGLSIDTAPQDDNGSAVFSKKNKNQGDDETSSPKQRGTRINEEMCETVCDHEIVWPPMVMVRYHERDDNEKVDKDYNEKVDKDDNEKWIAMGIQKVPDYNAVMVPHNNCPPGLLRFFFGYNAVEARHCFGDTGISLLIFENSATGYLEAGHLHKLFAGQGTDRDAWDHCKLLDGTRHQLYGYMANKEDIDIFNQQCQDGMKVKFEMRSHHEMVVIPMDGDNEELFWLYNRFVKGEKDAKARREYYGKAAEKLRETLEENRIVRQRTKMQHKHNKEEVHCELAEILDKETNREIVWPPMILVRYHEKDDNEKVDKDDNEKRIGKGHSYGPRGLLDYFSGFNAIGARYSLGYRGISLLEFENTTLGYLEAERLQKYFADQGADKDAWDHCKLLDGTRHQFYGYMANKEDVDIFNQHCGELKVKFVMRSHYEMVVIPMDGHDQHLFLLYSRTVKEEKEAKFLQDYFCKAAKKPRKTLEKNRIVRQRTKMQHEQNKEEARDIQSIIQTQAKNNIKEFETERENLIQILEGEKTEIKPKYLEEEVEQD